MTDRFGLQQSRKKIPEVPGFACQDDCCAIAGSNAFTNRLTVNRVKIATFQRVRMVGVTRIELMTPAMSMQCSP
ncbi:hypothetical protein, partial [Mesorhizobium sp. M2D.F.Ca.ET.223.01.1.1]|uniref:hypothetical protein n=1 Tax=Mesorhizobium sp. M2D.F.Ca.ET.223.01.1.1 TaxID=2563940 RepID=UPI001AED2B27